MLISDVDVDGLVERDKIIQHISTTYELFIVFTSMCLR